MAGWKKVASLFVDGLEEAKSDPEEIDVDALLAEIGQTTDAYTPASAPDSPPEPVPVIIEDGFVIEEGRDFADYYAQFNVPPSPKTTEEILAVLEGMKSLPEEARRIALEAMDASDNRWTMDDVRLNAQNCIDALGKTKEYLKKEKRNSMEKKIIDRINMKDAPVWHCTFKECDAEWAEFEQRERCPECSSDVKPAGFTLGEAIELLDKVASIRGTEKWRAHIHVPRPPPFELVQLSQFPQDQWVGLPVFHPMSQTGSTPDWYMYDVGVVCEFYPDPHFDDITRVRFVCDNGTTLHYSSDNLWVPATLLKSDEESNGARVLE